MGFIETIQDNTFRRYVSGAIALHLIVGAALLSMELNSPSQTPLAGLYHGQDPVESVVGRLFVKWDSYWYLNIVNEGYDDGVGTFAETNLAFPPLYPTLIALVSMFGMPAWIAGCVISQVCFFSLLYYLFQLGIEVGSKQLGGRLMLLVCAFPSSWTLHMLLTESLFCVLLTAFFVYYLRKQYWTAALCCFMLPLARIAGVCALAAAGIDCLIRFVRERGIDKSLIVLAGGAGGVVTLLAVNAMSTGDPLAFMAASKGWFEPRLQSSNWPLLHAFRYALEDGRHNAWWFLCAWTAAAAYTAILLRRERNIHSYFACFYMLILLKTPLVWPQMRYLLPLLPVHLQLGAKLKTHWLIASLLCMLVIQIVLTRLYLQWQITI